MEGSSRKNQGAYYIPEHVVQSLVRWVARSNLTGCLTPHAGTGVFCNRIRTVSALNRIPKQRAVHQRVPGSLIHQGDFFAWAAQTRERFGAPPAIHHSYATKVLQGRSGRRRAPSAPAWRALLIADFFVGAVHSSCCHAAQARRKDGLCRSGRNRSRALFAPSDRIPGRAFQARPLGCGAGEIVPRPLGGLLAFSASGFGGSTEQLLISSIGRFEYAAEPPKVSLRVSISEWRAWNCRLRPFLLAADIRELYRRAAVTPPRKD